VIKGEKILLRPLNGADLEVICQWEAAQHIATAAFEHSSRRLTVSEEYMSRINARTTRMFAIEAEDGTLIGDIGLVEINWRRSEAELVVRIGHPKYLGKGYGHDAISSLLDYVFSTTRLDRIYLRVLADNLRAVRCFERCGFRKNWVMTRQIAKERNPKKLFLMAIERNINERETGSNKGCQNSATSLRAGFCQGNPLGEQEFRKRRFSWIYIRASTLVMAVRLNGSLTHL
jgi:RimJ/RimL family protein N-acetyltransferase